ncbi:hypothetical protein EDD17DRAFT_1776906 [Pisolithus thermaeus]|nr:hypothetical protein EDD17DRAFT_1776906 [Pisolithus thermaeus]
MTRSIIHILPLELIIKIFMMLDYRSLLTCQQVSTRPLALVEPFPSIFSHKLAALRRYQDAWGTLQWTNTKDIPMLRGNVWELYGGVLALSDLNRTIRFRRLPSQIREIEEHVWSVSTFDMDLRDFTIDPAQDLLVLIARPRQYDTRLETAVHLRSLTTGSRHPLAPDPSILRHSINEVQVCEDCVAVHFISHEAAPSELVVWNWKTGRKELNLHGPNLKAISFLANHYMLVGGFGDGDRSTEALLYVLDLTKCDGEPVALEDVNYRCAFVYPPCCTSVTPLGFQIRADPMSPWVPPTSSDDLRLLVITMYVAFGHELVSFDLFVLSRACCLLSKDLVLKTTVMTSFASLQMSSTLEVWDFNPNGIRRERCRGMVDEMEWHDHDFSVVHHSVFLENIQTSLPYRVVRRDLPLQKLGGRGFADVLCSEDNLILVDAFDRNMRLLTF